MKEIKSKYDSSNDDELVSAALKGNKNALNDLIKLHEPFIYNVAWKFTNDENEAKDLTQEVLIKIITKLSTFKRKSSFRTWAYRIAFNQFLQTKRRPMEDRWESLEHFADELNSIPSPELSPEEEKEEILRTKTARTRCMSGMLMCLTREQRLLYLIGEVFKIDHQIGAEVFNISKDNYRKKLSRTRKEFHAFMNQQCGLVNLANPCRCSKKAKAMEAAGKMQTNAKLFDPTYYATIADYAEKHANEVADTLDKKYIKFFQKHPSKKDFSADTVVTEILNDPELNKYYQ
ncbi:RNA polymerase sigma factor [Cyclobacterium xiamenense]|uniref:RNA polymerase sigma factor n=1 Tax=Cyclobacterium xiamenense TaxID=1297121 RepID=UPI0035CF5999